MPGGVCGPADAARVVHGALEPVEANNQVTPLMAFDEGSRSQRYTLPQTGWELNWNVYTEQYTSSSTVETKYNVGHPFGAITVERSQAVQQSCSHVAYYPSC